MPDQAAKLRFYLNYMGASPDLGADEDSLWEMAKTYLSETVNAGYKTETALKNRRWEDDRFSRHMDVFEDDFFEKYFEELRGYVRSRVKGCSGQLTKEKVIFTIRELNRTHKNWWMRNDYKILFWERLRQIHPECCDGIVSDKLQSEKEYWRDVESPERRDLLPPTDKQKVYLRYFEVALPSWANRGDAKAFIGQIIENSELESKKQRWQKERFALYPDLYADEIRGAKFTYADSFYRYLRRKVTGAAGRFTEKKLDHILDLMDQREAGWFFSMYMEDQALEERNHKMMFEILTEVYPECVYSKGDPRIPPPPEKISRQPPSSRRVQDDGWNPRPTTRKRKKEESGCGCIVLVVIVLWILLAGT